MVDNIRMAAVGPSGQVYGLSEKVLIRKGY